MNRKSAKPFVEARTDLQTACLKTHQIVRRHVETHRNSFVWQMEKGLENDLFGIPIEDAENATFTADQIRKIARETGKSYSHACLAITPKILGLSSSIECLADGNMTIREEMNCFRSIVERVAVLEVIYKKVSCAVDPLKFSSFDELKVVHEIIMSLIGTRFDWSKLQFMAFADMPADTGYTHNPAETRVSLSATNILGQVDKLQKESKYKGIRPFYNFCCEFVHPNIGDLLSTTAEKKILRTDGGQIAYKTKLDENPLCSHDQSNDFFVMFASAYEFAESLIPEVLQISSNFGDLLKRMKQLNQRFSHRAVKKQSKHFSKGDYCPCGSGRSIGVCAFG